jgi:glycerophosphoryl diester phosphodiesterase
VVAHRGASADRLENTIDACLLAVAAGAPMLEIDVQLAADGELVVFHDWTLERLAGDGRAVESLTSNELRAIELALVPRGDDAPTLRGHAPTFAALLASLPVDLPLDVEVKRRHADRGRIADAVARAIGRRENALVSSFDWEQLATLRELCPDQALAPIADRDTAALLAAGERLGAWSVHAHRRLVTPELVAAAAEAGRPLLVYTVNEVEEARALFARGVAGVFTDHAARLLHGIDAASPAADERC